MTDFLVAMAVGIVWFGIVGWWFRPEEELRRHVVTVFALGMIICVPVGFFNTFWLLTIVPLIAGSVPGAGTGATLTVILLFLLVAPIEEIVKFLIVRSESYRLRAFDTVGEGVMLATFSALGFATYENYHYMQTHGFSVIYLRGWLCPPAHMLFSAFFGYYLGLAKTRRYAYRPLVAEGIVIASLTHGAYNGSASISIYLSCTLVVLYLLYFMIAIRTERHRPLLSFVAPEILETGTVTAPGESLVRPTLTAVQPPRTEAVVLELLRHLADDDTTVVLRAIAAAKPIVDQRLYDALQRLEHDPVDAVRPAAAAALADMDRRLDQRYDEVLRARFGA